MADTPWDPTRHVNPTNEDVEARWSFHPLQSRTSAAGKAHRALAVGGSTSGEETGEIPLAGHTHMHPVHMDHRERREGWTRSTVDLPAVHGLALLIPPWSSEGPRS